MSLALKRVLPKLYKKLKSIKNKIPTNVEFWDKKQYKVTNKINDLFKNWKTWDSLIKESDFVFKNYNGGDFIDVGASSGFFSFLLAPKSNSFDNFVSCEPDTNAQTDLLENLSILANTFNKLRITFINSPISNGDDVTIVDTSFGHPCFSNSHDSFNNKKRIKSISLDSLVLCSSQVLYFLAPGWRKPLTIPTKLLNGLRHLVPVVAPTAGHESFPW